VGLFPNAFEEAKANASKLPAPEPKVTLARERCQLRAIATPPAESFKHTQERSGELCLIKNSWAVGF